MNITELARRLNTSADELRAKLPELGFSIGGRALKVDDRTVPPIMQAWAEMRRRQRLTEKMEAQKELTLKQKQRGQIAADAKEVPLPAVLTVRDFAGRLGLPIPRIMQELMKNGVLASINERIDYDTAAIIAEDLGLRPIAEEVKPGGEVEEVGTDRIVEVMAEDSKELKPRPPVVVVMGHVDHGKTKLLDAIRKTDVVATEAGGITQHIGAYMVNRHGRDITFIDTPGHEAFTVMRSRGARVADLAILVVAADDGVQPQTKEAVDIIRTSKLPMVVALNKIDRSEANPEKVKTQLGDLNIILEEWGGKVPLVAVSAKEGRNIEQLLDTVLLAADLEQAMIQANPLRPAIGTIIESRVTPEEGVVATALVQAGTLHIGDTLGVRESLYGRVRAMRNWNGEDVKEATPSMPVKIIGFKYAPAIGDIMEVPGDASQLKKLKAKPVRAVEEVSATKIAAASETGSNEAPKQMHRLIIRSDVLGSLEAILGMLDKIQHELVGVEVVAKGLGNLTDADVLNAEASGAWLVGFNVIPTASAEELAREKHVEIRQYKVIYKLFEDVLAELQKRLPSETVFSELGAMEVVANFRKLDTGWIVGGKVTSGKILPKAKMRILRGAEVIGEGEVLALQSGRAELKEGRAGQECGLSYKGKVKAEPGDRFEFYTEEQHGRKLEIEGIRLR